MSSRVGLLGLVCLIATFSGGRAIVGTGKECAKAPPNSARISLGVDISTLDMLPIDFTKINGYKLPVVDFTCDEGRVYVENGVKYEMPDQMFRISTVPGGWLSTAVTTLKSSSDLRKKFNARVETEGTHRSFSFSASVSYSNLQNTIVNEEKYVSDTSSYHSSHKMELYPGFVLPLHPVAKLYLDQEIGDKTYKQNPEIYHHFIDLFGTHYFSSAQFGGLIRVIFFLDEKYIQTHSEEETHLNAKASYLETFSAKASFSEEKKNVDEEFSKHLSETIRYYGGNTNLISDNRLTDWQPTVASNPWLFSGKLRPISELFENETHRKGMEQAALQHVMRNHFKELRRQLTSVQTKLGYTVTVGELEERLDDMENLDIGKLVERDVKSLSNDIDNAVTVPRWFSEYTRICFRYSAAGDATQCGDGSNNELCALPGANTDLYKDNTDKRPLGCKMQWSIQSKGYEKWFYRVKLCFRWEAEDDIGQCSNAKRGETCAKINEYTKEYVDDTDGREGGCKMSWKLSVPKNAPVWLKTTKLCFTWKADKDKGQCQAPLRYMCVEANEWTSYYHDDTHERDAACLMSWGLVLGF